MSAFKEIEPKHRFILLTKHYHKHNDTKLPIFYKYMNIRNLFIKNNPIVSIYFNGKLYRTFYSFFYRINNETSNLLIDLSMANTSTVRVHCLRSNCSLSKFIVDGLIVYRYSTAYNVSIHRNVELFIVQCLMLARVNRSKCPSSNSRIFL